MRTNERPAPGLIPSFPPVAPTPGGAQERWSFPSARGTLVADRLMLSGAVREPRGGGSGCTSVPQVQFHVDEAIAALRGAATGQPASPWLPTSLRRAMDHLEAASSLLRTKGDQAALHDTLVLFLVRGELTLATQEGVLRGSTRGLRVFGSREEALRSLELLKELADSLPACR
ncbi:MAG: hypothetical protein VKP62_00670 [Candidatus Sericytochromatia bacterium]|nr:hypothetical protein [Candidatus Sericytochromatia bacterium]